jgi:hypothetical protein
MSCSSSRWAGLSPGTSNGRGWLLPQEKILGQVLNPHTPTKKDATYYAKYYPKKEAVLTVVYK